MFINPTQLKIQRPKNPDKVAQLSKLAICAKAKIESCVTFSPRIQKSRNPGTHLFKDPAGDYNSKTNVDAAVDDVEVGTETATGTAGTAIPTASTKDMITS